MTTGKKIDTVTNNFFPAMGRCDRCGRFMKRGLLSWMKHVTEECPGKSRRLESKNNGYPDILYVTPAGKAALDKAFEEYWNEIR